MTPTSREIELLVCVARRSLNDTLVAQITSLLEGALDWNFLCEKAREHRLLPLLYHHLNAIGFELVPIPILKSMREESVANSKSCLYLFSELRKLLRLFDEHGIKAAVFKGPVLASTVYGDVSLRQVGDLDILVERSAFELSKQLLVSAGYKMEPELTNSQQSSHLRFHCEIQFVSDSGNVVDLHWGLSPKTFPFGLDPHSVMKRAVPVTIQATSLLTFSPEDMILYLCFHGAKHYWSRLEWISSLAEVIRASETIEWPEVVARAEGSQSLRMLRLGLLLAQDFGELDIPAFVFPDGEEFDSLRKCAEKFHKKLFAGESQQPSAFEMFRWNLQFMDRRRDAITGLLRSVLTPTISDWRAISLPALLHPLYYGFRPIRLLSKYGRRLGKG
jgi:hypothetical protein